MKRCFSFFLIAMCMMYVSPDAVGEDIYPQVGKPCPDFVLQRIEYFPKKRATLADFKGKWLVLDFWNKNCGSCVASFPITSDFQKKFAGQVQFMLVGIEDKEEQIRPMYSKFRELQKLVLPCAFDSALSNLWGIYNCPHIIIIDDKGIVQGVTNKIESADVIQTFLSGGHPALPKTYDTQNGEDAGVDKRIPLDYSKPFLVYGNGAKSDTDYLFRSVLSGWDSATQDFVSLTRIDMHTINKKWRRGLFNAVGVTLNTLYRYAYFGSIDIRIDDTVMYGKYCETPILLTKDSLKFYRDYYSYTLTVPTSLATLDKLKSVMQNDLSNYFNYEATMETRIMPVWKLVATQAARERLRTQGGSPEDKDIINRVSHRYQNVPMVKLMPLCVGAVKGIVIDETGIKGNIDITIDNGIDFKGVQHSLRENGLELVRGQKEMNVLVIRDRM